MLFLKFFIVLKFACLQIFGKDYENFNKITRCIHYAIKNSYEGVQYFPYKYPGHISVTDNIEAIEYSNIFINNILEYKTKSTLHTTDGASEVKMYFSIHWPTIVITADAKGKYMGTPYIGKETFTIRLLQILATFKYQRPKEDKYGGKITKSDLHWLVQNVKVIFDPPVDHILNDPTDRYEKLLYVKTRVLSDLVSKYLNEVWLSDPQRIQKLFDFCEITL